MIFRLATQIIIIASLLSCSKPSKNAAFEEAYALARNTSADSLSLAIERTKDAASEASKAEELGRAYWLMGYFYDLNNDVENGMKYYSGAADAYLRIKDYKTAAMLLENTGTLALESDAYSVSLERYRERLTYSLKLNDELAVANAYFDLGLSHKMLRNLDSANHYQFELLQITELASEEGTIILDSVLASDAYLELGLIHTMIEQYDSARMFYERSIKLDSRPVKEYKYALAMGNSFLDQDNFSEAEGWLNKSLTIGETVNLNRTVIKPLNALGTLYYKKNQKDSALYFFKKSLALNGSGNASINSELYQQGLFRSTRFDLGQTYKYIQGIDSTMADELVKPIVMNNFNAYMHSMGQLNSQEMQRKIELANASRNETILTRKIEELERKQRFAKWFKIISVILISGLLLRLFYKRREAIIDANERLAASLKRVREIDNA